VYKRDGGMIGSSARIRKKVEGGLALKHDIVYAYSLLKGGG